MIRVEGRDLWRGGVKIGLVGDGYIMDHTGTKVGIYTLDNVLDRNGHKLAHIEGDYIFFSTSSQKIRIEDNSKDVVGGSLTNIQRAAVRILLGE